MKIVWRTPTRKLGGMKSVNENYYKHLTQLPFLKKFISYI